MIEFYTSAVSSPAIRLLHVAAFPDSLLAQLDTESQGTAWCDSQEHCGA